MTQPSKAMIGAYAGGLAGMTQAENITGSNLGIRTFSIDIVPVHYSRYMRLGDGTVIGQGFKQAEWHLNGIRDAHWSAFNTLKTAQSTQLWIRTLAEDGKTFKNYLALMEWTEAPPNRDHTTNVVLDFNLKFTQMVEYSDI